MSDPQIEIKKSIEKVASAVTSLGKSDERARRSSEQAERRRPVDVDLLTSEEVKELRLLIEHEGDLASYSHARVEAEGDKARGMYAELEHLGLTVSALDIPCMDLLPMAHWAVEKHDQRRRDSERDRHEQWAHDTRLMLLSTLIGGLLGILGTLLGVRLG